MQNYQFSWKLFGILLVAVASYVEAIAYWEFVQPHPDNGCYGGLLCPVPGKERLVFNSYHVNSPSNLTVTLSNQGNVSAYLTSYYVKDSSGDQYANLNWSGPTIQPRGTALANILLVGQPTGQPFQFQSGQNYTVIVVTSRNSPFNYTFTL